VPWHEPQRSITMIQSPYTRSKSSVANWSAPGDRVQTFKRLPLIGDSQFPVSPDLFSSSSSASRRLRFLLSTTHIPLVHWPVVSTRMSTSLCISHPGRSVIIEYHTQRGSCNVKETSSPFTPLRKDSTLLNVDDKNASVHAANGDPA